MKNLLLVISLALPLLSVAQDEGQSPEVFHEPEVREPGIYDSSGKKIFSIESTGESESVSTMDGLKHYTKRKLTDLETGRVYTYSHTWDQTMSNGEVFMNYHFNKRQWYWTEGKSISLGGRVKGDSIRRTYRDKDDALTTTEQGDYPILSYKDGRYFNELGEPVFSLLGRFPGWANIILLHNYYEQVYFSEAFDEIKSSRAVAAEEFANSNSLALEILKWGEDYEARYKKKEVLYFTTIDGEAIVLNDDQVQQIKNGWLVLNDKPRISGAPYHIPKASFYLSKRKAKKKGVTEIPSGGFVLEIQAAPEHSAEFRAALSQ